MYAEVAINVPVAGTFHYHVPDELAAQVRPGQLVLVDFGTAQQHGLIVGLDEAVDIPQTKPILDLLDARPVVTPAQITVARWISQHNLMPLGPCLWLFLPPGLTGQRDTLVTLRHEPDNMLLTPDEEKLVNLLRRRGPLRGAQLNQSLAGRNWRGLVDGLVKTGLLHQENVLAPGRVRPKMIRTAALSIHPDQIDNVARHLGRPSKQADLLEVIAAAPDQELTVEQALTIAETSRATLDKLVSSGLLATNRDDRDSETPLLVALVIPPEAVTENLVALRHGEKYRRILRVLARENGPMDVSWLYAQADAKLPDLKRLADEGLISLGEEQSWRDSLADRDFVPGVAPPLTPEQQAAWRVVEAALKVWTWGDNGPHPTPSPSGRGAEQADLPPLHPEEGVPQGDSAQSRGDEGVSPIFLLHGVTGSGKTEIYLRAIELVLAQGRQAIFLVPEIALTAQTVRRVASRFPGQVAVVHGSISEGERYDTWRRAREGQIGVVVGARSALFTPLPDIGLVILDEEHDPSYKQGVGMSHPYYHARQVAEQITRHSGGVLILGSATPDLETVYRVERNEITRLHLPNRIMGHRTRILEQSQREGVPARYYPANAEDALTIDLPPVRIIDMREELKVGNRSIFSRDLQSALADVLDRREQAMLFLNRRGKNTYVFCRDCGYVDRCPACDIPLAYHQYDEIMRCHMCGYRHPPRKVCPACESNRIKYFGAGTQHIEQEMHRLFPMARVLRWDADTARTPRAHEDLLQAFIDREADVLIGTQMVAKGLDLPLVTLVGMVSADVGLNLPDFRAGERTFQLLTQVAGRAGRGLLGGQAILQTYEPEHYVIRAASRHDYDGFYRQEMHYRREMAYPPVRRMIRILFQYRQEARAAAQAERAAAMIQQRINRMQLHGTSIIGPTPCFFGKINYVYRWHLLVRGPDPALALAGMDMPREWYIDVDPVDLL